MEHPVDQETLFNALVLRPYANAYCNVGQYCAESHYAKPVHDERHNAFYSSRKTYFENAARVIRPENYVPRNCISGSDRNIGVPAKQ